MKIHNFLLAGVTVFAVIVIFPAGANVGGTIAGKRLVRAVYCSNQVLVEGHRYQTFPARSKVECLGQCRPQASCVSIVYDSDSKLCHLGDAMANDNCSNMEPAAPGTTFYQEVASLLQFLSLRACTAVLVKDNDFMI